MAGQYRIRLALVDVTFLHFGFIGWTFDTTRGTWDFCTESCQSGMIAPTALRLVTYDFAESSPCVPTMAWRVPDCLDRSASRQHLYRRSRGTGGRSIGAAVTHNPDDSDSWLPQRAAARSAHAYAVIRSVRVGLVLL